jgi:hypothetical protein
MEDKSSTLISSGSSLRIAGSIPFAINKSLSYPNVLFAELLGGLFCCSFYLASSLFCFYSSFSLGDYTGY